LAAGAEVTGASWTGAAALDGRFGAGGGFLAAVWAGAAGVAGGVAAAERGAAGAAGVADAGGFAAAPSGGSGVMMLTAGVEAELGNSALVGLPVGTDAGSAAISPDAACAGAFQDGA
jgi:hypothetical protein